MSLGDVKKHDPHFNTKQDTACDGQSFYADDARTAPVGSSASTSGKRMWR